MNLSTTLNKCKQGEGGNALLFYLRLLPVIILLVSLISCGIPSPIYLAPPERIAATTDPSFYHADRNNPDIFSGYEIFYLYYDSDSGTIPSTDDEWETYFNNQLSSSTIANPNSSLMAYAYTLTNPPGHGIRRAYASETVGPDYIPVMIPVNPDDVDLAGDTAARFQLIYNGSDDLLLKEFSSTPETIIASILSSRPLNPTDYNLSSVILKRRVFKTSVAESKSLLSFYDHEPYADDLPDDTVSYSIAFFAVTTGSSFSTGQVISSVTYIGSLDI